jgi:hypothetical protein
MFGSNTEDSQINHVDSGTQLVTISVGGDDIGFADVLQDCITGVSPSLFHTHGSADCQHKPSTNPDTGAKTDLNGRENALIADLGTNSNELCQTPSGYVTCAPRLASLYYDISTAAAKSAKIYVLLYPHEFTNTPPKGGCTVGYGANISRDNMVWINQGVDRLDSEITTEVDAAKAAGIDVTAVDTRPLFDAGGAASPGGHGVCSNEPWIYGIKLRGTSPAPYSFHPNPAGQGAFESAMLQAIKNHP